MKYRTQHTTVYSYSQTVVLSQNEARLQPRNFWRQDCGSSRLEISPAPMDFQERTDFFGNRVIYFAIQEPHCRLTVTSHSEVSVSPKPEQSEPAHCLSWEQVRHLLKEAPLQLQSQAHNSEQNQEQAAEIMEARLYMLDSPMITASDGLYKYAEPSFLPNCPLMEVVQDLMQRIYHDFTYDPVFTTIATPLSEVLHHRRGVCQDFAHLAIGCLRSFGIAARYISGYIETQPEAGRQRLEGADASHAWFAVYIPGNGWLEFDPTNNKQPEEQHITLAWGRDFSDVTPLKGIAFGGGQHTLSVSVDVSRLVSDPSGS
jgi:transglutaminase-like putative cysteine protease